ncbi:DivIVA domain-containing protein [Microbacterium sediminis]|uniref:Cell wall synthesis protein Wag31 n=1 Tax=Microbacterium sediminis TaxID=904291 RepID=A0A1B9N971_9MICO|nr:DivIVA domain-containing protein [Microbacterium sediminis]OCG73152.1 cell division protein [Microbacterium sediminis]QBR74501.1 DivIVA domain-containing protein [Microbacterium sediminis]
MALTPDDVVTKQFQHVRFKEGFDPDEVDDFLDEIVVEWRKALEENAQLKARIAELEASGATAAPAPVAETPAVQAPAEAPVTQAPAAAAPADTATSAVSIIERAQRLHDEHVAEGRAEAEKLVNDARGKANDIIAEAERKQQEIHTRLENERKTLEGRITELRGFERDYRQELRNYFETKLKDLDASSTSSSSTPVSAIGL